MTQVWFKPTQLEFQSIPVRGGSSWVTLELSDSDGLFGTAETIAQWQGLSVPAEIAGCADRLRGQRLTSDRDVLDLLQVSEAELAGDFLAANVVSALRGAVVDALAKRAELPLHAYLQGTDSSQDAPKPIGLYANVNRALFPDDDGNFDRSPEAFATVARAAERRGFSAVKCAPFDECQPPYEGGGLPPLAEPGLERVMAIRQAVGAETAVYVDCHRRFDLATSTALAEALHEIGVTWFEESLDPFKDAVALRRVREISAMPVAGGEKGYGYHSFARLLEDEVVDIVMPDVMFCGGPAEAFRMGKAFEATRAGSVSLHCPEGPVALLASAHVTAAVGGALLLEHAADEVPWRHEVLEVPEKIVGGAIHLPDGPGLGTRVDQSVVQNHGGRRWVE